MPFLSDSERANLEARLAKLAPVVSKRSQSRIERNARWRVIAADMTRGIVVQAIGSLLGAALIYLMAVLGGLLEGTRTATVLAFLIFGAVALSFLALLVYIFSRRHEIRHYQFETRLRADDVLRKVAKGSTVSVKDLMLLQQAFELGVVNLDNLDVDKQGDN